MIEIPQQTADLGSPLERYMRTMVTQLLASMARALRDEGLSLPELAALHLLEMQGSMRIGDLGAALLLPMPAASRLVDGLVRRQFVERHEDPVDRRAKAVTLSPQGLALIEALSRQRIDEATREMVNVEGEMSEKFLEFYAQIGAQGLDRTKP